MELRERRQKLIDLGAETLAEALLNLAGYFAGVDELIKQLIATPEERISGFKKKLASLKRSRRFLDWRETDSLSLELEMLLKGLKSGVDDPLVGLKLIIAFYEADSSILGRCDDSNGIIGNVFRSIAPEVFVYYALRYPEKDIIADFVLKLNKKNDYGVRDVLVDTVGQCLPEDVIRNMIATLQKWADKEKSGDGQRRYFRLVESLARQIKDAKLFEDTRITWWRGPNTTAFIDIASVYLESGDVETAHTWMKKIPTSDVFQAEQRDRLLEDIYRKQGDIEKLTAIMYRKFTSCHSTQTLQGLLDVIGQDKRDQVLADEISKILNTKRFQEFEAQFLIAVGKIDEAENYLLKRADQLNGNNYAELLALAKAMEAENRLLVTSLMYRSLLLAILERGNTKAYSYGVGYLKKLESMASVIADWQGFADHDTFKEHFLEVHGRKRSFWSKYEVKK